MKYLHRLAAEIITGEPIESYSNPYLDRGHAQEEQARSTYAFIHGWEPTLVGFIKNGPKGCSPDAMLGEDGLLEIKTQRADLMVETLFKDTFPSAHKAQVQGALWVAEREWADLVVFAPGMPLFVKREHRDDAYIAVLEKAVDAFNAELAEVVAHLRKWQESA
jgi:hypothetical protein